MKTVATVAAMLVLMTASMQAQNKDDRGYFSDPAIYMNANIPAALKAFESCLSVQNEGVQESAMAHLAMLKLMVPSVEASEILHRLEGLSTTATSPGTRFKAYIASQVYQNPEIFASERAAKYNDGDELFNALAARLQSSLLSYEGH
jgi:hypothetical protein